MYFVWQYPQGIRVLRELSDVDSYILAQVYKGRCVLTGNNVKVSFYPLADSDMVGVPCSSHAMGTELPAVSGDGQPTPRVPHDVTDLLPESRSGWANRG
jgi:hypothetical protein